ncbi:hypothetical protein P7C70_g8414, partial [Phenoliferia sp. Uapishka_3]
MPPTPNTSDSAAATPTPADARAPVALAPVEVPVPTAIPAPARPARWDAQVSATRELLASYYQGQRGRPGKSNLVNLNSAAHMLRRGGVVRPLDPIVVQWWGGWGAWSKTAAESVDRNK